MLSFLRRFLGLLTVSEVPHYVALGRLLPGGLRGRGHPPAQVYCAATSL